MVIRLRVGKWRCEASGCERSIFAEQLAGVMLPKMWRKVPVRAFAAIFYETDLDGESQYCRKLCDYPRALGDLFGAWTKATDRMQCISPA